MFQKANSGKGPAQAPQRPNWLLYIWLALLLWLGMQWFHGQQAPPDNRTDKQTIAAIQDQAQLVRQTAATQNTTVAYALKELTGEQKIPDLLSPQPKLSADEDLEQMRILNGLVCDLSIQQVEKTYEDRLKEDRALSEAERNDLELKSEMLVADTLLKAAYERHDMNRVAQASYVIMPLARFNDQKPIWQAPIQVIPTKEYPAATVSPAQITQEVNGLSTQIGQTTLVFGFFPGYQFVNWVVHLTGAIPNFSYWFTALLLAFLVRALVYPISQKQMMWSRQMQQLTPLVKEIKDEYKGRNDPQSQQELQRRTMELYKEYGMNPLQGCLPAFLQTPVFLLIYYSMLNYRFEFQRGTFLWINPATSAMSHGFLARSLGEKDYVLIVIYGITMITTALLQPVSDPSNVRQQRLMGVGIAGVFGIMMFFWPVPSAFILYWTFTNLLTTAQSWRAYRLPLPPLVKKNAPNGGVYPSLGGPFGPGSSPMNGKLNGKPKSTGAPKVHKPKKKK